VISAVIFSIRIYYKEEKMKKITLVLMGLLLAVSLAFAGGSQEEAGQSGQAEEKQLKIVYISPDPIGVNEFLKMGVTGLEKVGEKYNAETQVLESEDPTTREQNVRAAVAEGADIVIVLGFEFNDIIPDVAKANPDVNFLIVDQCIEERPDNVSCAVFREHEGSFLIGVLAAHLTESEHIGVIGELDIPFLHRYTDAFKWGAEYVNEDIQVDIRWVGGENPFSDPARAKEQALALHSAGADQIYAVATGGNVGIFQAAKQEDFQVYGIDVNQCPEAPGYVVECMIKRVDRAIVESVDTIIDGQTNKMKTYGLEENAMGLISLTQETIEGSQCLISEYPDLLEKVKEVEQKIIDGEIEIEDPMFQQ